MKNLGMKIQSLLLNTIFSLNFIFVPLFAQEIVQTQLSPLEEAKNQFVQDPWLQNASLAVCVVDLKTKQKIISHNDRIALPPASTVKLFATASAFEILGANYKPKTRIYFDNKPDADGTLKGNLWVRGGGIVGEKAHQFPLSGLSARVSRACALRRRRFSRSAAASRSSRDLSSAVMPAACPWVDRARGGSS